MAQAVACLGRCSVCSGRMVICCSVCSKHRPVGGAESSCVLTGPCCPCALPMRTAEVRSSQWICLLSCRPGRLRLTSFGALLLDACVSGMLMYPGGSALITRQRPALSLVSLCALRSGLSAGSGASALAECYLG